MNAIDADYSISMSEFKRNPAKSDFHYHLPEALIAQVPLKNRSGSRMLCLDGCSGALRDGWFTELPTLLVPGDLLILNDTRVIPARLFARKDTGGKVEILIERIVSGRVALAHIRASKAARVGTVLHMDDGSTLRVIERQDELYRLESDGEESLSEMLDRIGHIPLPPYIRHADGAEDRERYQTVFANRCGAIAAPTAGLHFDQAMLTTLAERQIDCAYVTLHVGSGTFQPIRDNDLSRHRMHAEYCEISAATVDKIRHTRARGGRVVAVGTTVVRTLESAATSGQVEPFQGETRLFILPGFRFNCVDALLTNFHLPESTLLSLVCAFAGYEPVMRAYEHAVRQQYRFFSYGDCMFLTRAVPGGRESMTDEASSYPVTSVPDKSQGTGVRG
jgi:S-adenosylmethionine:tRNA ribosyltransferase-isomerase